MPAEVASRSPLRQQGVYLITGGLGRIGLTFAGLLAKQVKARLVLTSRDGLPAREQWDDLLQAGNEGETARRIRAVQALEQAGAEVMTCAADVSNEEQMRAVIDQTFSRFGALHGVIHASGIVGQSAHKPIEETTPEECEMHFAAKARGLRVLEKLLEGVALDFCMLSSSLSSALGGLGYCAYSAANIFMDGFARQHNQKHSVQWASVNWDGWRFQADESASISVGARLSQMAITPDEGEEAFKRLLAMTHVPQILVSTGDLQPRIEQWVRISPREPANASSRAAGDRALNLTSEYKAPETELEKSIADAWQQLLGVEAGRVA